LIKSYFSPPFPSDRLLQRLNIVNNNNNNNNNGDDRAKEKKRWSYNLAKTTQK